MAFLDVRKKAFDRVVVGQAGHGAWGVVGVVCGSRVCGVLDKKLND